jgi:hypothetical protein
MLQEGLGHRDEPFFRPVMAVEVLIEGEEALQVAPLGRQGLLGLPGDFGHQVEGSEVTEAILGGFDLR